MKKKLLSLLLICSIGVSMLAACGNSSGSETSASSPALSKTSEAGDSLTLAIWDSKQEPGIRKICDDFTEKTGVKVDVQITPWEQYWTMLEAGATGSELPDVFWMHATQSTKYSRADLLMDLTERAASSDTIEPENYFEDIYSTYTYEGKQYALPKDIDTVALWYNKEHFDEAGLDYPDATWTWSDMKEAAMQLTTDDHYGYGARIMNYQETFYNYVYANGGHIISDDKMKSGYDDPKTIEAIEYFTDMVSQGSSPDNTLTAETDLITLYESGKVSMAMMGSWNISRLVENESVQKFGAVAVMPMADDGTRVSIYNGLGYAAAANTSNPEGAWQLVEYLSSKEAQEKQAALGVTLSAYKGTSDAWATFADGFDLKPYLDVMDDTLVLYPSSVNTTAWEDMSLTTLVEAWNGASVEETCKSIAEEMNALLAEE